MKHIVGNFEVLRRLSAPLVITGFTPVTFLLVNFEKQILILKHPSNDECFSVCMHTQNIDIPD